MSFYQIKRPCSRKPPPGAVGVRHTVAEKTAGHWLINESSGNILNDIFSERNQATQHDTQWSLAPSGAGLYFDGVNSYVDVQDNQRLRHPTDELTVYCRATLPTDTGTAGFPGLVYKVHTSGFPFTTWNISQYNTNDREMFAGITTTTDSNVNTPGATVSADVELVFFLTWKSGSPVRLRVFDGFELIVDQSSGVSPGGVIDYTAQPLRFGQNEGTGRLGITNLAQVFVLSEQISDAQVREYLSNPYKDLYQETSVFTPVVGGSTLLQAVSYQGMNRMSGGFR